MLAAVSNWRAVVFVLSLQPHSEFCPFSTAAAEVIFSLVPLETANKCRRVHNLEQDQKLQIRKISVKENDMFRDSKTVQTRLFLAFLPTPTEGGAALFQPS